MCDEAGKNSPWKTHKVLPGRRRSIYSLLRRRCACLRCVYMIMCVCVSDTAAAAAVAYRAQLCASRLLSLSLSSPSRARSAPFSIFFRSSALLSFPLSLAVRWRAVRLQKLAPAKNAGTIACAGGGLPEPEVYDRAQKDCKGVCVCVCVCICVCVGIC